MSPELNVFVTRLMRECFERADTPLDWGGLSNALEEAAAWVEWERDHGSLREGDI